MKRILSMFLLLTLMLTVTAAQAVTIDNNEVRNITVNPAGDNPVIEGESPTTGRPLSDYINIPSGYVGLAVTGRYMPVLVQIDNTSGGAGNRAPWGTEYLDIVYETPLYRTGITRLSFLYSDVIPDFVGPCRSARVMHAWLREEWDCGFCYYGQQEYEKTNVLAEFSKYKATKKGVLFSGTAGLSKAWKKYYSKRQGLVSPHDKAVNLVGISSLIPESHTAANHTWLFTDEMPEGDEALNIYVSWGNENYNSFLEYDEDEQVYYRYLMSNPKNPALYIDHDTQEPVTFDNVIVQFVECAYPSLDAPLPTMTGTGNADYFMMGKHIAGVWQRGEIQSRTVFYGADGEEIKLTRGRTLVIIMDGNTRGRSLKYD